VERRSYRPSTIVVRIIAVSILVHYGCSAATKIQSGFALAVRCSHVARPAVGTYVFAGVLWILTGWRKRRPHN
jgi:hypothetical protein